MKRAKLNSRFILFFTILLLISKNIFATDLSVTQCFRPTSSEWASMGFRVNFRVANLNIVDAQANEWSVEVIIRNQSNVVVFSATVPGVFLARRPGGPGTSTTTDMLTSTTFNPSSPGNYTAQITVLYLYEIDPSNDRLTTPFTVYGTPSMITSPSPVNFGTNVPVTIAVGWTNGSNPFSQTDVFFVPSPSTVDWNANPTVTSPLSTFNSYDPPGDLTPGSTYNWGVRQTNGAGSTTNGPFSFTVAQNPPNNITNISPPNHETNFPTTGSLSWTNGSNTISQTKIFVSTSPTPINWNGAATVTITGPANLYTPSEPWLSGTTYNWGVQQSNSGGTTNNGPFDFTTSGSLPNPITNISPPNGTTDALLDQVLSWVNGSVPFNQTVVHVWTSPTSVNWNTNAIVTNTSSDFNSYTPTTSWPPGTLIQWGVQQTNNYGTTNNGPFGFTTQGNDAPAPITNISPLNGTTNVPVNQPLSWTNGSVPFDQTIVHIWTTQSDVNWNTNAVYTITSPAYNSYTPTNNWPANTQEWWGIQQINNFGTTNNGPYSFYTRGIINPYLNINLFSVNDPNDIQTNPEGLIDVGYLLSPNGVFINILATNRTTNQSSVILNNLYYPGSSEAQNPPTFSSYFDFTPLLSPNSQVPTSLDLKVYISNSTITNTQIQPFPVQNLNSSFAINVGTFNKNAIDKTESPIANVLPVTRPGHTIGDPMSNTVYRSDVPNLDLNSTQHGSTASYAGDLNACVPTATANSVKWLQSTYTDINLPADMDLRKTMETLSSKMNRLANAGTDRPAMVKGILDFTEQYNLPLEVKFQSWYINGNIGSTSGNSIGRNFNSPTQNRPQWDFIKQQMKNGENVVINYTWESGGSWYGHSVCLTGIEEFASSVKKIKFKHDAVQANNGGTKEETHEITVDADGWVRFGTDNRNFIHTVVAESPVIPFGRETAAWLNELFVNPTQSNNINSAVALVNPELFEIALSSNITDLNKYKVNLYNGADGKLYSSYTFNQLSKTTVGDVTLYYINLLNDELKPPPAGIALSYSGSIIQGQFLSYGGSFTAEDGEAQGLTSTNIGNVIPVFGFALSGSGTSSQSFGWTYTGTSSAGFLNTDQTYTANGPSKPVPTSPVDLTKNLNTTVNFIWDAGQNAQSYELRYSQDPNFVSSFSMVGNITTTSKEVSSFTSGSKYYWQVRSKNSSGVSAFSNKLSFSTKLPAPANLNAQLEAQSKVRLTWLDPSTNEDGFAIERKLVQGNFSEINKVNSNILTYLDNNVQANNSYSYRVMAYNSFAESDYSNIATITVTAVGNEETLPNEYKLYYNYPNPFNPSTEIKFALPKHSKFKLVIYNLLGQIMNQYEGIKDAGNYSIHFEANNLPSGIYIYTLIMKSLIDNDSFMKSNKMLLIK